MTGEREEWLASSGPGAGQPATVWLAPSCLPVVARALGEGWQEAGGLPGLSLVCML